MAETSPLRRRMIEDMTVRNLSPATQRSYVHAVAKFGRFFGRSPDKLDLADVRVFQVHLVAGGMSWPALNQTVCALRFLYGVTLGQADLPERIPHARERRKLPVVLGADEVVRFLEAVPSLKARAALTTAYAAGLRASEGAGQPAAGERPPGDDADVESPAHREHVALDAADEQGVGGLLGREPLADAGEHRHLPIRPIDLQRARVRQAKVGHVVGRRHRESRCHVSRIASRNGRMRPHPPERRRPSRSTRRQYSRYPSRA